MAKWIDRLRDPIWEGIAAIITIVGAIFALLFFISPSSQEKLRDWLARDGQETVVVEQKESPETLTPSPTVNPSLTLAHPSQPIGSRSIVLTETQPITSPNAILNRSHVLWDISHGALAANLPETGAYNSLIAIINEAGHEVVVSYESILDVNLSQYSAVVINMVAPHSTVVRYTIEQ